METSSELNELAVALTRAQAQIDPVELDSVNPFLKNKYASFGAVIAASKRALEDNGLSLTQFPTTIDGEVGVTTVLLHTSGQYIMDTITLPLGDEKGKSLAQVAGSIISYLKRYSWSAVMAMYADEDTDGNSPAPSRKPAPRKAASKPDPVVEEGKKLGGVPAESSAAEGKRDWGAFYAKINEQFGIPASKAQSIWAEKWQDRHAYQEQTDKALMEAIKEAQ